MNTLESYSGAILGKEDECARFVIDDVSSPFLLTNIAKVGEQYTFSFWLRAETTGSITACGKTFAAATEWVKYETQFTAESKDVQIAFNSAGTYYIYQPQLESGTMATAWRPAPEDLATTEDVTATNEEIAAVTESVSSLNAKADNISDTVAEIKTSTENAINSTNSSIETLRHEVETKMTAEAVEIQIRTAMESGATKVVTETGFTFDSDGLTVEKTGSEMKTQITEDGMTVYQNEEEVLEANSNGVNAKNLHATTYLIVGGRSRFENFGNNRTGCFWIGG